MTIVSSDNCIFIYGFYDCLAESFVIDFWLSAYFQYLYKCRKTQCHILTFRFSLFFLFYKIYEITYITFHDVAYPAEYI